jgi:ABC-2 type transport system permease protein
MNIFIREMKSNRKALIIWSICMILLVFSGMGKYTAYSAGAVSGDVFAKMPEAIKALLGISTLDVTKMSGFYALLFPYLELTAAIHAVLLGNAILAKEERDKTTEFIMVKPISRYTLITQKLLAALINILILNVITLLFSLLAVAAYNKGVSIAGEIIVFDLSMFLVQLIFLSLGALLAAFMKKPKGSGSIGTGILLAGYIIAKVTDLNADLSILNLLSPFKYFNYVDIANGNGLNAIIVLITILMTAAFASSTYYFYLRRDLNI